MAAGSTYTPIATATISSGSSYTFSSIPSTYTDLHIVISNFISAGPDDMRLRFNGDTSTNYSALLLRSSGGSLINAKDNNGTYMAWLGYASNGAGDASTHRIDVQSYANTSVYKHVVSRGNLSSGFVNLTTGMWRSTAAINSITFIPGGSSFAAGSTITIYGIKAA